MELKERSAMVLQQAYKEALAAPSPVCRHSALIDFVIDNTHLTFKYILFTALLAKASDGSINPLCLQKKSDLPGAYDARTICHKVIVPFEMRTLEKVLGGSNEPYLNKPARFPHLDKHNAVRRGNDQALLNALCDNLPTIQTSEDAYESLVYLLHKLIALRDERRQQAVFTIPDTADLPAKLLLYIDTALARSYEGEVLTLLVAGVYHLLYQNTGAVVEVHPVNQCGASGREVSDLDIYDAAGELISSNELKDKDYAATDVRHAADKVLQAGGCKLLFIEGPRAAPLGDFRQSLQQEYLARNFLLHILSYRDFFSALISSMPSPDCGEFLHFILSTARETKFKEEVVEYLDALAQQLLGLRRPGQGC